MFFLRSTFPTAFGEGGMLPFPLPILRRGFLFKERFVFGRSQVHSQHSLLDSLELFYSVTEKDTPFGVCGTGEELDRLDFQEEWRLPLPLRETSCLLVDYRNRTSASEAEATRGTKDVHGWISHDDRRCCESSCERFSL